jgi:hypothetical protein
MTTTKMIDGNKLICSLRNSPARFHKLRSELIKDGATDGDIVRAMAGATEIIDTIGTRSMKVPKPKYGK